MMTRICESGGNVLYQGLILILVPYYASGIEAKVCPEHWFGTPNCTYKCNCVTDCSDTGECTTCKKPYFGLNCQYVDLAQVTNRQRHLALVDGDDKTCSTTSSEYISVVMPPSLFTHFTLVTSDPAAINNISYLLGFNDAPISTPCVGTTLSRLLKPNVKVFYCATSRDITEVILAGKGVPYLCTVNINGGRNVALKQTTLQAATKNALIGSEGVDGEVTKGETADGSCYVSPTKYAEAIYGVTFDQPMMIFSFRIVNVPSSQANMYGFSLFTYDTNNGVVMNYLDQSTRGKEESRFPNEKIHTSIKSFILKRTVKPGTSFEFCEIEAYGDCPPKRYGLNCSKTCSTLCEDQLCMPTGMCWQCKSGYYGTECTNACSVNCIQSKCDQLDGKCEGGCKPKRFGPFCDKECNNCLNGGECDAKDGKCVGGCAAGFSGPSCAITCPVGTTCKESCSSKCIKCSNTTECLECETGRFGPDCEFECSALCLARTCLIDSGDCTIGCSLGYYGRDCVPRCSDNCGGNRSCNRDTGACLFGCKTGFYGEKCVPREQISTCPVHGFYGDNCTKVCGENCGGNKACEQITGECLYGCIPGFGGVNCSKECINCLDNLCDQYTSKCSLGCAYGFVGPNCVVGAPGIASFQDTSNNNFIIISFLSILALCILVYLVLKRKNVPLVHVFE